MAVQLNTASKVTLKGAHVSALPRIVRMLSAEGGMTRVSYLCQAVWG